MLKNKCIFCGEEIVKNSVEHIFPDAIGGEWTIHCVCKSCNDLLGSKVDCLLTKEPLILYLRSKYQIPNKEKKYVDLTKELQYYDMHGKQVFFQKGDGEKMPPLYIGSKPNVVVKNDSIVHFSGSDYESVAKSIQRQIVKKGIHISTSDIQRTLKTGKQTYSMERVVAPISFNIYEFCPCVLKIAYESAICVLGERYIEDDCGKKILLFLNDLMNCRYDNNNNKIRIECQMRDVTFAKKEHFIQIVYNQKTDTLNAIISIFDFLLFFVTISYTPKLYAPIKLPFIRVETLK